MRRGPFFVAVFGQNDLPFPQQMRHPVIGIRGSKPRVAPSLRQMLAEEAAQERKCKPKGKRQKRKTEPQKAGR